MLIGLALLVLTRIGVGFMNSNSDKRATPASLEKLVTEMNSTRYPKTSPDGVRIERLSSKGYVLTYHKTFVDRMADEFPKNHFSSISADLIKEVCHSELKTLLKDGVSVEMTYNDKSGKLVGSYTAAASDCK